MGGFVFFGDSAGLQILSRCSALKDCRAVVFDPDRLDVADAARLGCPAFAHPNKERRPQLVEDLRALAPALGIICSYSRIVWPELLQLFPQGVANLHNAPLPAFRGANALQWTIITGECETAATLHYVDDGIDTGPVIDAIPVAIGDEDTALTVRDRLIEADVALLNRWLPRLLAGPVPATPQDESLARYWPRRTPEDGRIDWSRSDREIRDLVRALVAPWPGAWYETADGRREVIRQPLSLEGVARLRREQQT